MPKEPALPRPHRAPHSAIPYSPQSSHPLPTSFHHVQQYLPRPQGYQFYPAPAAFPSGPNDPPQPAQPPTSSQVATSVYEHALKMSAKFDRGGLGSPYQPPHNFKISSSAYDQRSSSPAAAPQTSVPSHKPASNDRSQNSAAGYRTGQLTGSSSYDHRLPMYTSALPYDRFSKKKLAAHVSEKTPSSGSQYTARDKNPSYERLHVPSTSYERLSSKVTSSPVSSEPEKHMAYDRHHKVCKYDRAPVSDYRRHEERFEPSASPYDRIAPTVPTSAPSYERPVTTQSYERLTLSSAAYERRAVFDRAYEAAAYERRLFNFPTSQTYYAQYARTSGGERPPEEYEAKESGNTYPAKPRMSLLTSPEYLRRAQAEENRSGQPSVIVPPSRSPADGSPRKTKLRDSDKPLQPLTIDTSMSSPAAPDPDKPSIYMPTVEPISPTSPPDGAGDDGGDAGGGAVKSSAKDNLLVEISRVDREINKCEHHIYNLKRKQVELEQKAKKSETDASEEITEAPLPQHFSLSHKIYSENRRKARENHAALSQLGPPVDLPLYNQPSDTDVYRENKLRHLMFKGRLVSHLRRRRRERCLAEKEMTADYTRRSEAWNRLVEKMEGSPERKRRDAENRELFEKVFPKIRKEREDRERFLRVGSRVKSDADLEEIMDNLHEQEMEVKKMRDYAAVPPLLLSAEARRCVYVNTNGRMEDFGGEYKERRLINVWTDAERAVFREKYLLYPKNFGVIASYLERKSVSDCVQHYYLSKKTENYKRLLKKSGQKTRAGRNRNKTTAPPTVDPPPVSTPPGPTIAPRFQRDYKPSADKDKPDGPVVEVKPGEEPPPLPPPPPPAPPPETPQPDPAQTGPPSLKAPPYLPLLPDMHPDIVVIDDSDDSNSSSHFAHFPRK